MGRCNSCPFECQVDRITRLGVCNAPLKIKIAKYMPHFWEEPCISGTRGSGTIFFSYCNASCLFCQNYLISQPPTQLVLSDDEKPVTKNQERVFITLCKKIVKESNVHNLNLVSPTHYTNQLLSILPILKEEISLPIIWNSNGYEKESLIKRLSGLVDVFLPDLKYFDNTLSIRFSKLPDYFKFASKAIMTMKEVVGEAIFNEEGIMQRGLIIRHLVLPGQIDDSKKILSWIAENLGIDVYISLMAQYYPVHRAYEIPEINRRLLLEEYQELEDWFLELGFENGFLQDLDSNSDEYTPKF
ncbi:MAG: radical SAM protein [bacterium]